MKKKLIYLKYQRLAEEREYMYNDS